MSRLQKLQQNWHRPHWWFNKAFPFVRDQVFNPHSLRENILYGYFARRRPGGFDLMAEDWDNCYILDACRYDLFTDQNPIEGELESRISPAPATPGFLEANFSEGAYHDTVYVTANPMHAVDDWCSVDLNGVFHAIIDTWRTDWDDELGTVPPENMAASVRTAAENYPNKRILAHFLQPHHPFIGSTGRTLYGSGPPMMGREKVLADPSDDQVGKEDAIWERLRRGEVSKDVVMSAYRENLDLVFPHIDSLLDEVSGRSVITSDHGNLLGEILWPLPWREYGHPTQLHAPQLIKVPWLIVESDSRRHIEAESPQERNSTADEHVRERLSALGYS